MCVLEVCLQGLRILWAGSSCSLACTIQSLRNPNKHWATPTSTEPFITCTACCTAAVKLAGPLPAAAALAAAWAGNLHCSWQGTWQHEELWSMARLTRIRCCCVAADRGAADTRRLLTGLLLLMLLVLVPLLLLLSLLLLLVVVLLLLLQYQKFLVLTLHPRPRLG